VLKLLLEKVAELESKDKSYGLTPLLYAVEKEHEAVVKLLLEKGRREIPSLVKLGPAVVNDLGEMVESNLSLSAAVPTFQPCERKGVMSLFDLACISLASMPSFMNHPC
jgi:hypothetical protein